MSSESTTITTQQKKGFVAAWLGWAFDGLDGFMYTLIALPVVTSLMHQTSPNDEVKQKAALIQAVFLVGWALGGLVFGRIGDIIGRTKTLNLTILTYAIFTGLAYFSTEWWHLLIFRFIAALGIGGEWAAGAALVGETLHRKYRHWASAILQSGYMFGMILAAFAVKGLAGFGDEKLVFLVGVIPAFLTLWIRKSVPEPEEWAENRKKQAVPKITELFKGETLKRTLQVLTVSSICLCGVWTLLYFSNVLIRTHPENAGLAPAVIANQVSNFTLIFVCINIVGNFFTAWLTNKIGFRKGFLAIFAVSFAAFAIGFYQPLGLAASIGWFYVLAFFALGVFGAFPLYFPMLFPTLLRTTGAGFCYNIGRVVTAVATLSLAALPPQQIIFFTGFLYIPAILIALTLPELPTED
ncbi:MAG TPA: MFS transporter [Fimbriimonas sp.]|nr:MFS transporter [Fimbriimonas sp.]